VLSLGPLKRLALRAQVISPEPQPRLPSTGLVPPQAEEEPSVAAKTRVPATPTPLATATAVEEGEAVTEATVTQAVLEVLFEAGPSVEGVVTVLYEDSAPLPLSESHNAAMAPVLEPTQVPATASLLPAVEVPVPSPAVGFQGPLPIVEVAKSSSARVSLTVEEMMDLETCQYIDFPSVGVIDLEAPQLPEKEYEVAAERTSNEPTCVGLEGAAGVRARQRLCLGRCNRRGGCGPRGARGSRGADRRCVRTAPGQ
jgi:hypothetical protein